MTSDDWKMIPLGHIADFRNGINYDKNNLGKGIKVIGVADFQDYTSISFENLAEINPDGVVSEEDLLKDGDILFVRSNGNKALIGRSLYINGLKEKVTFSGFTIRLRLTSKQVYPLFFAYFFKSHLIRQTFLELGGGTNISNLSQRILKSLLVPLPPQPEQYKIAEILSTWDSAIDLTTQLITVKQQYKRGLMQQLLTGQRRFKEFSNISWSSLKAGDIFQPCSKRNNGDEKLLSVTQEKGVIPRSLLDTRVMMPSGETANYKLVERDNFIISLRSFQGGIEYSKYRGLVSPAYTVLTSKQPIVSSFYKHLFKSQDFISRLGVAIIGIRDGKQINFEDFATIRLAYPTIEEQKRISDVLDTYDYELALLDRKLMLLKKQKQGLMQQLLTGKIRVKI